MKRHSSVLEEEGQRMFGVFLKRPFYTGRSALVLLSMRGCPMAYDVYRITIKGHLDPEWSDWFDGLTITPVGNGETILTGPLIDQTALHGVLIKIRDLGLPLLSLTCIEKGKEHESNPFLSQEEEGHGS
jgi:hypothetical protein